MAEIMETDTRKFGGACEVGEYRPERVGIPRLTVALEHQRLVARARTGRHETLRLFQAMAAQTFQRERRERDLPARLLRLGLFKVQMASSTIRRNSAAPSLSLSAQVCDAANCSRCVGAISIWTPARCVSSESRKIRRRLRSDSHLGGPVREPRPTPRRTL